MNVLEVVASLDVGGAERVAIEVAAGLNALPGGAWNASLAIVGSTSTSAGYSRSIRTEAESRNVAVHDVPFRSAFDRRSQVAFLDLVRRASIDIVHIHNRPRDWQLVTLCRLAGIPVLYSVHKPYVHSGLRSRLIYASVGRAVRPVICVSQAVADHVSATEWVPQRRLRVIHNGIRTEKYQPLDATARAEKRRELGWREDQFIWLCAARFHPQKAHEYALRAMALLPPGSGAKLMLAGEGPLENELRGLVDELAIGDRVTFMGARSDVPELLGAADAYLSCSREEGHPLALLEAMACALPILAPRLPSVVEISSDNAPQFFGPPVRGIARSHDPRHIAAEMLRVEDSIEEIRMRARVARSEVDRRFSIAQMVARHVAVYSEVESCPPSLGSAVMRMLGKIILPRPARN